MRNSDDAFAKLLVFLDGADADPEVHMRLRDIEEVVVLSVEGLVEILGCKTLERRMNYFDDFVAMLKAQSWLSEAFRQTLILRFMEGQKDAYERGRQDSLNTHVCDLKDPLTIAKRKAAKKRALGLKGFTKDDRAAVRAFIVADDLIGAIKKVREIADVSLWDAKKYVEKIQKRIPVGINTVTGKNRYRGNK